MIFTHHTSCLHDCPGDYWRFSAEAWKGLFSGCEIMDARMGDPVRIVPLRMHQHTVNIQCEPDFIHSMVIVRKPKLWCRFNRYNEFITKNIVKFKFTLYHRNRKRL